MLKFWMPLVSTPPLAVPPSSLKRSEIFAIPDCSGAGVKVSTPVAETVGPALNNAALSFAVMVKVRPCAVSGSPSSMAEAQGSIDCAPESSSTVWFGPTVKLGASLMPLTVMVTFCGVLASTPPFAVPPLSLSTTVRVAVPDVLAVGVKLRTPAGDTAGPALNRPGLVFAVTLKLRV